MRSFSLFALTLFALSCFVPSAAHALSSGWQRTPEVNVRLVSETDGVGSSTSSDVILGLDVELAKGWHTYWRSPGMAGLPPQFDWSKSESDDGNLKSADILYPAPARYTAYGLETVGYRDHVLFPIVAHLREPGKALRITTDLSLLVCSSTCVPKNFTLTLDVPAGAPDPSAEFDAINQARKSVPVTPAHFGMKIVDMANDGQSLRITIDGAEPFAAPDLFLENARDISFGKPTVTLSQNKQRALFIVKPVDDMPEGSVLAGTDFTLTMVDGAHAFEQVMTAPAISDEAAPPDLLVGKVAVLPEADAPALPLYVALLFGLVGGLILNLMPCVLPVLSLKILGAIGHGGGEINRVRRSFLMTAAGIVFSFMVLACVTIALKSLGLGFGWGVQFQQPVFLILLVLLLTFFAANLWGLFDIHLPSGLADTLAVPKPRGGYHPKPAGDFVTGAFATLLATPCSAPFLGTAVGFALAAGPREILAVFAALGLGMSLPYLAVALLPRLATALPKPGAWMLRLRALLGIALAATAVWLLWVLSAQITSRLALIVALCMIAVLLLLTARRHGMSRTRLRLSLALCVGLAVAMTSMGAIVTKPPQPVQVRSWQPFAPGRITAEVAKGHIVFVDVTAAWCLTCKANERLVLAKDDVQHRLLDGEDIVSMQADWTNPDPVIAGFLHRYGRYGIPFNIVFGPGVPQGIVLPELLSHDAVMKALDDAAAAVPPVKPE